MLVTLSERSIVFYSLGHLCVCFRCSLVTRHYPSDNVVGRLQHLGLPPCCYPSYRISNFYPGKFDSYRTRQPLLDAQPDVRISRIRLPKGLSWYLDCLATQIKMFGWRNDLMGMYSLSIDTANCSVDPITLNRLHDEPE